MQKSSCNKKRSLASKGDIFKFVQQELNVTLKTIEDLGNGIVYCQLFDRIHGGSIPMKKIKSNAKQEWENIHNLKLLQSAFEKQKISKAIEIQKLSKQKFLDNLNFMQWFIQFYEERRSQTSFNSRIQNLEQDEPSPAKKVKVNEEDVVSFGSFFKASEFKQQKEDEDPFVYATGQKDRNQGLLLDSQSMLISPMIFKSEFKRDNRENQEKEDKENEDDDFLMQKFEIVSKILDTNQREHNELQEYNYEIANQ